MKILNDFFQHLGADFWKGGRTFFWFGKGTWKCCKREEKRKDILVNVAVGQLVPKSVCVGGKGKEVVGSLDKWPWVYQVPHDMHGGLWRSTLRGSPCLVVVCWGWGGLGTMERNKNKVSAYRRAWHQLFVIHWHNHGGQKNRGPRPTLIWRNCSSNNVAKKTKTNPWPVSFQGLMSQK